MHDVSLGFRSVVVQTPDSDIFLILLSHAENLCNKYSHSPNAQRFFTNFVILFLLNKIIIFFCKEMKLTYP